MLNQAQGGWSRIFLSRVILCFSVLAVLVTFAVSPVESLYQTMVAPQSEEMDFPREQPLYHPVLLSNHTSSTHNAHLSMSVAAVAILILPVVAGVFADSIAARLFDQSVTAYCKVPLWLQNCKQLL